MRGLFPVAFLLICCGGSAESEAPPRAPQTPRVERAPARPPNTVYRDEITATVDRGLGSFLQRIEVEPAIEAGRFVGFRVVRLSPPDFWQGVDLRPGDVVTSVNGMPIERETEAFAAFEALRTAKELKVRYLRDGAPRELTYRIVERTTDGAPPPAAPADTRAVSPTPG